MSFRLPLSDSRVRSGAFYPSGYGGPGSRGQAAGYFHRSGRQNHPRLLPAARAQSPPRLLGFTSNRAGFELDTSSRVRYPIMNRLPV